MSKLEWNSVGNRFFENGIDLGVLYSVGGVGVAWNGLVSITESPTGSDAESYYLDGQKYLNQGALEEYEGNIEAYMFPPEFAIHSGSASVSGLYIHEQFRESFGLSYRTFIGSDVSGLDHAYQIHLIYNALAIPSDENYVTQGDDTETLMFSWNFVTVPTNSVDTLGNRPLSHISIRSDRTTVVQMRLIEDQLYGTEHNEPRIVEFKDLLYWFTTPPTALQINENVVTGINPLTDTNTAYGDLIGSAQRGLYFTRPETRLVETEVDGLWTLAPRVLS